LPLHRIRQNHRGGAARRCAACGGCFTVSGAEKLK
jgi:hypothetical protein